MSIPPTETLAYKLVNKHFSWLEEEELGRYGHELAQRFAETWAVMALQIAEETNQSTVGRQAHIPIRRKS